MVTKTTFTNHMHIQISNLKIMESIITCNARFAIRSRDGINNNDHLTLDSSSTCHVLLWVRSSLQTVWSIKASLQVSAPRGSTSDVWGTKEVFVNHQVRLVLSKQQEINDRDPQSRLTHNVVNFQHPCIPKTHQANIATMLQQFYFYDFCDIKKFKN